MNRVSRAASTLLAGLALVVPVAVGASAANAAPRQPVVYDALGDSYASGYGVPPYSETCGRSQSAYAVQLDGRMKIDLDDFVACAGATTTTLVSGGQLDALDAQTDLVTVSIGGNDIHWGDTVGACLLADDTVCAGAIAATQSAITNVLPGLLDSVYTQIGAAAPDAHVVVTGYPRLFSPKFGTYLGASPAEQRALNDGADLLNQVIKTQAKAHGFQFVSVTHRFVNHGANAPRAWIHGLNEPGAFHPNLKGYKAYTAAVTAALRPSLWRHAAKHSHHANA